MKKIIIIFCLCCGMLCIHAQVSRVVKPTSVAFHAFYMDFKKWSKISNMQMGYGLTYFKGIKPNIDLVSTLDVSSIDYTFKDGTTNGTSKFLLDANAGINLKLSDDTKAVVPYLFGGAGFSYYKKMGLYLPVGLGVQINVFNEAFITSNLQYKMSATSAVSNHYYYTVGIGLPIGKPKKAKPIEREIVPEKEVQVVKPITIIAVKKNLMVKVVDEQTHTPLPNVMLTLIGDLGTYTATTDLNGEAIFRNTDAGNYTISGLLNGVKTKMLALQKESFNETGESIAINLSHHDPRFTLSGFVVEKNTNMAMGGVTVSILDKARAKTTSLETNSAEGKFTFQLGANSDYTLSAKKANYISNIETVSTVGLNRSTTLYVKILLGIEETKANATISLKNIYYATGSAIIKRDASSDLDRLVLFLNDNPNVKIEVASHTDSRGSTKLNLALSKMRAQEVVNYLKRNNINESRIIAKGYGETKLLNNCSDGVKCTEELHEQNRRTSFKIISN